MRLIDADALMRKFKTASPMAIDGRARQIVNDMPTIESRKRGRWIDREENMEGMTLMIKRCSECGASKPMKIFRLEDYKFNFCPNCGADMREP